MLNAYGNSVKLILVNRKEVDGLISLIVAKLANIAGIQGMIFGGSMVEHSIDYYADVDLKIFCDLPEINNIKSEIYEVYKTLGAEEDNYRSIHSPFDDFGFQFGDIYAETDLCSLAEVKSTIDEILSGYIADEGLVNFIQYSTVVYDKNKEISNWQQEVKKISVSKNMLEFCIKKYGAVSLKLLYHAIKRKDYPSAHHWLWRTFIDSN